MFFDQKLQINTLLTKLFQKVQFYTFIDNFSMLSFYSVRKFEALSLNYLMRIPKVGNFALKTSQLSSKILIKINAYE